jgi:hypothetical protein
MLLMYAQYVTHNQLKRGFLGGGIGPGIEHIFCQW